MTKALRIVIIDDHTLFRDGLATLLKSRNIEVVASVGSGQEGMAAAKKHQPDVILLDLQMPDIHGHEVLQQLVKTETQSKIVILTTSDNEQDLIKAMREGASGYLIKDMDPDSLVLALHKVMSGKSVFAEVRKAQESPTERAEGIDQKLQENLTPRETETLNLLAEGCSNKMIAQKLSISEGTVKLHVKAVLRKLGVHSRVEAAVMAVVWKQKKSEA